MGRTHPAHLRSDCTTPGASIREELAMPDIRPTANSSALVLNATYEPLGVVSVRRATILVLSAKAVCVADGDGILHSERDRARRCRSVVRLTRFVRVPYRAHVGLSRRAIFARDGWRCAYCRGPAETIDHVLPRSRGGGTPGRTWSPPAPGATTPRATRRQPNSVGVCTRARARRRASAWRVLGHRSPWSIDWSRFSASGFQPSS